MTPGDIVLIRFPQADLQKGKLRPALIVAKAPGKHPDLLLSLISSSVYQAIPNFDEIIEPSDNDFVSSGLKVRSVVRTARLASVEASAVNARLGQISSERLQIIRERLIAWLQK
jgi:mRNA interferase MazF